jgi:hypothetical protein
MRQLVEIIDTLDWPINVYDDGSKERFRVPRDLKCNPLTEAKSAAEA